jgi:hypothetical protein
MVRLGAAVLGIALLTNLGSAALGASPGPTASTSTKVARLGDLIHIAGAGWQADSGNVAFVTLCGNAALDGEVDCAVDDTQDATIYADGTWHTVYTLDAPPYPCPCVLRINNDALSTIVEIPITVLEFPSAPPYPRVHEVSRSVAVARVHMSGIGPLVAWFGGSPHRTLTFRVTNTGQVDLHDLVPQVVAGRGAHPTGFIAAPKIGDLAVGQSKTFSVPVAFPALSVGWFHALVTVDPSGSIGSAGTRTFAVPWAPILIAQILCAMAAYLLWRRPSLEEPALEAGWYPDPLGQDDLRFWEGAEWTDQTRSLYFHEPEPEPPPEPGWYLDPMDAGSLRLWDGAQWVDEAHPRDLEPVS